MSDALERFGRLVRQAPDAVPLDAACAAIGAHLDAAPEASEVPERLDEIAAACPGAGVEDLTAHLFGSLGLHGDLETYDEPENSFLHRVIERRRGLPISLSIITVEVGRRLGLNLVGVGMPGHFLVGDRDPPGRFLDPFVGGRVLDRADCEERFHRLFGPNAAFVDAYLEPTPTLDVLARVLANLRAAYTRRGSRRALADVLRLRAQLPHERASEDRELATALESVGAFDEAAAAYEQAAVAVEDTERARLEARARRLRARLN
jgi:regulator of sirC expression with transglutaminase-like and TPR domain